MGEKKGKGAVYLTKFTLDPIPNCPKCGQPFDDVKPEIEVFTTDNWLTHKFRWYWSLHCTRCQTREKMPMSNKEVVQFT